jgi:DNA polymerase
MREILDQIKGALELELALGGPTVPTEPADRPAGPKGKTADTRRAATPRTRDEQPSRDTVLSPKTTTEEYGESPEPRVLRKQESEESAVRGRSAATGTSAKVGASSSLFTGDGGEGVHTTRERFESLIDSGSPLHGFGTLEEVARWAADTILIPLDEIRLNPVFGVGNPNANLMVIGEAPGADEDQQGEPFVGRAGQLLNKILEAIGFARSDVYIANILKSRPPNNRNPYPAEIEAHIPILYKQIALIQPQVILCVGKISASSLLQRDVSLGSLRGRFHDFHGVPLMVTYHPAALLRNPQWKKATWEDVQKLREKYDALVGISGGRP